MADSTGNLRSNQDLAFCGQSSSHAVLQVGSGRCRALLQHLWWNTGQQPRADPSRTDNPHGIQIELEGGARLGRASTRTDRAIQTLCTENGRRERSLGSICLRRSHFDIQPQPGANDPHERFNWDAPILVAARSQAHLFRLVSLVAPTSRRSWQAVSPDLTRNENRVELPIMGKKQSIDNAWDFLAMSNYNTITSIAGIIQTRAIVRRHRRWVDTD